MTPLTAAAMVAEDSLIARTRLEMLSMAVTVWRVVDWMPETCSAISAVARVVWTAKALTSEATTAKPLPASPARADSMVAFSAKRLVWAAMPEIISTIELMRSAASLSW